MDKNKVILDQLNHLLDLGQKTLNTRSSGYPSYVQYDLFSSLRAGGLSFLKNTFGIEHPYYTDYNENVSTGSPSCTERAMGILNAIKVEVENGWLTSLKELISSEIFSDLMDMSDYFLKEGYKDPSAIMTGCVLEQHLRHLCGKINIDVQIQKGENFVSKKADTMNVDLAKANVYNKLDQKNVLAWLDLRNKAAHGKFGEYSLEQVKNMNSGVIEFISRTI